MSNMGVTPQITLFIILLVLLIISAFFAASETALMAVSRVRLRQIAKKHARSVKTVETIMDKPEKLIGTILLGNNLVNVAMSAIATAIALSLWGDNGIIYVTIGLTIIILLFAEITPKVYAKYHAERLSILTAPIMRVIMIVLRPFTVAAIYLVQKMLLVLGINISKTKRNIMTEAEVKTAINISWEDGAITAGEKDMLARIFTLNDKAVADVMVPRRRMITLRSDYSIDQALRTIKRHGYSRYPIRKGNTQEIIGFIHAKDLLGKKGKKRLSSIAKMIRPPYFISETKKIDSQLRQFKLRKTHQAIVLNEKGDIRGLVTLEDIIEQLVGSIDDEYDV